MYLANADRYDGRMPYRTCGNSGLRLPAITLGLWHNFGDSTPLQTQREMLITAFDAGITHFDLANNYGPPAGSAETNFGAHLRRDFKPYRDELIISSKAGWDMWPGPYGSGGGSRKYLLASLDQSLQRMGLDYVDIFYSHRFDPDTPLEETMGALATAVQQGKALYVGISSYSAKKTAEASKLLRDMGIPCLIHQPSYSLLNRWIEAELLDTLQAEGMGCIAFSPLAQGLLTDRYLNGVPADSRMNRPGGQSLKVDHVSPENVARIKGLNDIAAQRGQTLAQMAVAWVLRDPRVTSALIGASKTAQISELVGAVKNLNFDAATLSAIDELAVDGGVNLWQKPSTDQRP
ncbi:L-glyceraldehyde 3-phosphate reductase [Betaproteobacteria bacterium LSUCC0117]|jgi:L-glyceraldehyde 3-phosphate reductase|nr:L-glyceraldehyde 3-phosphate reductase [Betaproteobacteria bacterium LSUCC0117]MDP4670858.1 L-glyceraldehyde 3-phosphate reductase [Burkholderiaceae bacterium]MDP4862660.1 L-glyceraldehyde 3-phosphate reductase [Burkholderiaceae bacterium]